MQPIGVTFDGTVAATSPGIATGLRRILGQALQLLERLGSVRSGAGETELPPEFFKYPPV
jgi:hypothetical protein